MVGFTLYDFLGKEISPDPDPVWVKTDASGEAIVSPAFTLHVGDRVELIYLDAAGSRWFTQNQALP